MKHIGLFEGIGGFSIASSWMGWETIAWCEINNFCQKILKYHFPNARQHEDIKQTDFSVYRGFNGILTGGFPCQDASKALQNGGGQKGLSGERTGLWWHMCRAIDQSRPKYVVSENVANLLKINGGQDFSAILTELSRMGYNAEWRICYSSEVGSPHKRARMYLVAYPNSINVQRTESFFSFLPKTITPGARKITGTNVEINADGFWLSESPIYSLDDGLPERLDKITFSEYQRESIRAGGNSVTPHIPYEIFKSIQQFELNHQ